MVQRTCSIGGCSSPNIAARRMCWLHYGRWYRHGDPLRGGPTDSGKNLNWLKDAVVSATPDRCIEWPFGKDPGGYGVMTVKKRPIRAHRMALILATGEEPEGMQAAHAPIVCHNPSCVNPHHLRWATGAENSADRVLDGTAGTAKLRPEQVRAIRRMLSSCIEQKIVARQFGVTPSTISHIATGRTWSHVK